MILNIRSFTNRALKWRDFIIDLIFPIECLGCSREGSWLCQNCFRQLEFRTSQYCFRCKSENSSGSFCAQCRKYYYLDGVWIASDYENLLTAKLIKNLKYRFIKDISHVLGKYLILFLNNLIQVNRFTHEDLINQAKWRKFNVLKDAPKIFLDFSNNLMIPVPLSKKRQRWRGFNQVENVAKLLTKHFNIKLNTNNLIRIKHKKPQAKLKEVERKENIKNCFIWKGDYLNGKNIILVDDVVTTGSTLNECARVLKGNGAGEVWGLVIAKG